jgi:PAS domain S-box-containing protein
VEQPNGRTDGSEVGVDGGVSTGRPGSDTEVRVLTDAIPDIVWITRPDGYHVDFNQRWYEFTGLTPAQSLGDGWNAAFHPDDRARSAARWRVATDSGEAYEIEYRLRRADGVYRWMLGRALPLRDASGAIDRWFGTCTDIDDLKRAEARVREQARLLDLTEDAICVHDLDHRVEYWNAAAHRLHGWSAGEAVGRTVDELHGPGRDQLDRITTVLRRDGVWAGELRLVDRAGRELVVEARWTLVRGEGGEPRSVLAVHTDVTERRRIETQFLRTQRLESIGTLAGGIAHDLNNTLTPILAGAELLRHRVDDPAAHELLDVMLASANRGTELVRQVLSFARGVDGERVDTRLETTVDEVVAIARTTFPKDVEVDTDVADDLWGVVGDPTQLHQVLMNLCVNARDAVARGGRVVVRVRNEVLERELFGIGATAPPGRYVVVEVEDDGGGIPGELLERAFEPFVTTKATGSGSGLGLSTVLGIVTSHGGTIDVDSVEGRGSRFTVHLPAGEAAVDLDDPPEGAAPAPAAGGRVLVVDDEEAIVATTSRMLVALGYDPIAAADGPRALELFREHHDGVAVVLTDVSMPGTDGPSLVRELRRIDAQVPVVATGGALGTGAVRDRDELGVQQLLPKPYSGAQLRSALLAAIEGTGPGAS